MYNTKCKWVANACKLQKRMSCKCVRHAGGMTRWEALWQRPGGMILCWMYYWIQCLTVSGFCRFYFWLIFLWRHWNIIREASFVASFFNLTFAPRKTRCFSAATSRFNAINVTTVVSIQESTRKIKVFFYFFRFIRFYAKREIQGCRVVHFSYISLFFDVFQLFRAPSRFRCDVSRCGFLPYE